MQTFFSSSGLQRYFTVLVPEESAGGAVSRSRAEEEGKGCAEIGALLGEWRTAEQMHEKEMEKVEAEVAKTN